MEKEKIKLVVADYSMSPGPRYSNQGDDSGEDFYHAQLNPKFSEAYNLDKILEVNLDGPDGYASSFLDEAFGNLVFDFSLKEVKKRVEIISSEEPEWIEMLENETYPQWEERRKHNTAPKKTFPTNHQPWNKLELNKLSLKVWIPTV